MYKYVFDCLFHLFSFPAVHRKGFIFFVIFSSLHMLLTCYLFKTGRPLPWSSNVSVILIRIIMYLTTVTVKANRAEMVVYWLSGYPYLNTLYSRQ